MNGDETQKSRIGLASVEFDTGRGVTMFDEVWLLPNGWVEVKNEDDDTKYYSPNAVLGVYPH